MLSFVLSWNIHDKNWKKLISETILCLGIKVFKLDDNGLKNCWELVDQKWYSNDPVNWNLCSKWGLSLLVWLFFSVVWLDVADLSALLGWINKKKLSEKMIQQGPKGFPIWKADYDHLLSW